jgi:RluA family pseudouridine synthase
MDYTVLYSDSELLVVNKPAGLLTIPDGYHPELPCLSRLLSEAHGPLWIVHRLDKDTSGVILFARSAAAHKILSQQFENRLVKKTYHAISPGELHSDQTTISLPLRVNGDRNHRTVVDLRQGKPAETQVEVIDRYHGFLFLAAHPHTGYTHQIRSHLAAIGLPILCDPLYRSRVSPTPQFTQALAESSYFPIQRVALHAYQIQFTHPTTTEPLVFQAPLSPDMQAVINFLQDNYGLI